MKTDYSREVKLHCPTCASSLMEVESLDTDLVMVKCPSCGRTMTKDDLIGENGETIAAELEEMTAEVMQDIRKDFHASLEKAFRGLKNVKIR